MAKLLRAIIIGPPASGKGTISSKIVKSFDIVHVSTGNILRLNSDLTTENGCKVKSLMDKGLLVPDDIMMTIIQKELNGLHHKSWLLDGFPRTRAQAELLSSKVNLDLVINLVVDKNVLLERINGRWIHLPSGRVYHDEYNPPKTQGRDDLTGEELIQRLDDNEKSLERRLDLYSEKIPPVLSFYEDSKLLQSFHGKTSDEIWPNVKKCLLQYITAKN
ncbi:GTP:AMP phosphotransferase AK3, mitochondrial [Ischnura elegans]|uniref:GTP:AMP phosphotransferase AK3, mitochondrial n=1 Tax=Ischnura elegans TaxID=197161 RepID=UPI001ED88133|nr:GTP:AMP phosphotransferase AK3, mitochondrial [Ischnura elegans]